MSRSQPVSRYSSVVVFGKAVVECAAVLPVGGGDVEAETENSPVMRCSICLGYIIIRTYYTAYVYNLS